jgi:hypothetical protein
MQIASQQPTPTSPTTPPDRNRPWTDDIIGRNIAAFDYEFPNPGATVASAVRVLGDRDGYDSLEDARAAVDALRPVTPPKDPHDWDSYPPAVAYVKDFRGTVAAVELDTALLHRPYWRPHNYRAAGSFMRYDERVVAVDNRFNGIEVPCYGNSGYLRTDGHDR